MGSKSTYGRMGEVGAARGGEGGGGVFGFFAFSNSCFAAANCCSMLLTSLAEDKQAIFNAISKSEMP